MSDHGWGPRYGKLAARAKQLGWNGCGSFWGLCSFTAIDDRMGLACAGPNVKSEVERVLSEIDRRLAIAEHIEEQRVIRIAQRVPHRSFAERKVRSFRAWLAYHIQPKG